MVKSISKFIDKVSVYLSSRKGLLPIIGIVLILINLIFQFFPLGWLRNSNLFLHLGLLIAIVGFMLSWAL